MERAERGPFALSSATPLSSDVWRITVPTGHWQAAFRISFGSMWAATSVMPAAAARLPAETAITEPMAWGPPLPIPPHGLGSYPPSDPSDDEEPPELPPDTDKYGGGLSGNSRRNAGNARIDRTLVGNRLRTQMARDGISPGSPRSPDRGEDASTWCDPLGGAER